MNTPDARLLGFVRHLRHEGYVIGVHETLDALHTLHDCPYPDIQLARNVIRSLACRDYDSWQRFDTLFISYWFPELIPADDVDVAAMIDPRLRKQNRSSIAGLSGSSMDRPDTLSDSTNAYGIGAGRQKTISQADFRFLNDRRAMREAERLAERLAILLQKRLRYRRVIRPHGSKIDIRRTLRRNISFGGMPVRPSYTDRRQETPHIIILHDISHSMTWNNPLLFRFARGLVRAFPASEAFAFHTRLFRVTDLYRERSLKAMKERLESRNHLWFGGTCIAESLQYFNQHYSAKIVRPRSIVIILSDGCDTNSPENLGHELECLKSRSKKIIWLNPMLGRYKYCADTESMKAALPHIDLFAPAHSLASLADAVRSIAQGYH